MHAITLDNLCKTYPGGKQALKEVSLSLSPGEVFGFLGPNGAGKTTAVKLLNGILSPTAGSCLVYGIDPTREPEKVHAISGVMTEHAQMYDHLTGMQNLIFYASLFGIRKEEGAARAASLLSSLELTDAKDQKLAAYSTGMRQRLSLARAFIHHPKVLFLDEPTSGLDPESIMNVNRLIQGLAKKDGVTVFLCTHQLRYAQEICTRYGLIEDGRLLASGTLKDLREQILPGMTLRVRADSVPAESAFRQTGERQYERDIRSEDEIPVIIRQIVEAGGNIYAAGSEQPSLEQIYFALTAKGKETPQ